MNVYLHRALSEFRRIPNQLTGLRVALTIALYWLVDGDRTLCLAVFFAAGATDLLDGYLARRLSAESEFGRALDSFADSALFVFAMWSIWKLRPEVFVHNQPLWVVVGCSAAAAQILALVKLKRFAGFHLYSARFAGGITIFSYLWGLERGYNATVHYIFAAAFVLRQLEAIAMCLLLDDPYADLRPSIVCYSRQELGLAKGD